MGQNSVKSSFFEVGRRSGPYLLVFSYHGDSPPPLTFHPPGGPAIPWTRGLHSVKPVGGNRQMERLEVPGFLELC